jgi:hypothetical protein
LQQARGLAICVALAGRTRDAAQRDDSPLHRRGPDADGLQSFEDRQGGPARELRRVLKRHRRAEYRHDPIAREALNDATLFTDRILHQPRGLA